MRECGIKNQLASRWMHRGMALANLNSTPAVLEAVSCFDRAIALRQTLPVATDPWFRYALSAGWINRADALRQLEHGQFYAEALKSYDEALGLLSTLPLDRNPLYCRRLAITWLHRGVLLQQSQSAEMPFAAVDSFREAISVLELPNAANLEDHRVLLAAAWANLGGALTGLMPEETSRAASACVTALGYARDGQQTDPVFVEVVLKAADALCCLVLKSRSNQQAVSPDILALATDAIEETLLAVAAHKEPMRPDLVQLARRVFRFGCLIYERYQPHFLAEYINDCLGLHRSEYLELDSSAIAIARQTVRSALAAILSRGFSFLDRSQPGLMLSKIRGLRQVAEQLQKLTPEQSEDNSVS
jgi:tetratricopeptide (TPR) repeat protein